MIPSTSSTKEVLGWIYKAQYDGSSMILRTLSTKEILSGGPGCICKAVHDSNGDP